MNYKFVSYTRLFVLAVVVIGAGVGLSLATAGAGSQVGAAMVGGGIVRLFDRVGDVELPEKPENEYCSIKCSSKIQHTMCLFPVSNHLNTYY